jgi:AraC-like DNA-binding protein
MKTPRIPPLGLVNHPRRTLLVLESDFADPSWPVDGYDVRVMADHAALREEVRAAPPCAVVLVRAHGGAADVDEVRALIGRTPSVPVVAGVVMHQARAAELRALVDAGVAEVAMLGASGGLRGVAPVLRRAHAQPVKRRIEARLPVWMPEDARTLIRAAAETVVDGGGRQELAGIFGVYDRTVAEWCRELDLPPPRRLLGWVRVLLALSLLEEAHRTAINVARACGYNDNSSLKRAVENFAGTPPSTSIRDQRFGPAFDRFADELRALRHDTRARRTRTTKPRPHPGEAGAPGSWRGGGISGR